MDLARAELCRSWGSASYLSEWITTGPGTFNHKYIHQLHILRSENSICVSLAPLVGHYSLWVSLLLISPKANCLKLPKMHLSVGIIAVACLGTAQAASYLSANQPCGNNKECETNCGKATYHIAVSDNSTYFACTFDGNSLYAYGACASSEGTEEDFSQSQLNAVCEAAAGQNCRQACVFPQANREDFSRACKEIRGNPRTWENFSYDAALSKCKKKAWGYEHSCRPPSSKPAMMFLHESNRQIEDVGKDLEHSNLIRKISVER